ncbi:MAG: HU family DNA-binding protein [Alistipes indistinctus]
MTKADIVNTISKETGVEKAVVRSVVEEFMEQVRHSLIKGENVYLRGFGTFLLKHRAAKTARNISKNTTIVVPAHNTPAFKPAKIFHASIAQKGK